MISTVTDDSTTMQEGFESHSPRYTTKVADIDLKNKREMSKLKNKYHLQNRRHTLNQYEWIEKLLVTPISDYRKCTLDLILAPYLIVIKEHLEKNAF